MNSVGIGKASLPKSIFPSGPPPSPSRGSLFVKENDDNLVTQLQISWEIPDNYDNSQVDAFLVEWWSPRKSPEIQTIQIEYFSPLKHTSFTLSYSPKPNVKRETAMLPWNATSDLVRRELINLGWNELDGEYMIDDLEISRQVTSNGFIWSVTFASSLEQSINDGDQVALVGNVIPNGDNAIAKISIMTIKDGRRSMGRNEVQFLQLGGTGSLIGFYRLTFASSEFTPFISSNASAAELKRSLEQLSTIGEVDVTRKDLEYQKIIGTNIPLIRHYEITFVSNVGNLGPITVDSRGLSTANMDAFILIHDGDNGLNHLGLKQNLAIPGETPLDYSKSQLLNPSINTYTIDGLTPGREYFVTVMPRSKNHGFGKRMLPSPLSIIPPLQTPLPPRNVSLAVNRGFSDSLLIHFNPPLSDGGDEIIRYRIELDPTPLFDNPIVENINCPNNNKKTVWKIETKSLAQGIIYGGSFSLQLESEGISYKTGRIPYDAVALSLNETGTIDDLSELTFSLSNGSTSLITNPTINIVHKLFPGDRLRFEGQKVSYKYYEIMSVEGSYAILNEAFDGIGSDQLKATRHYGGRGSPSSSRIHCGSNANFCSDFIEARSGSMQNKLNDLNDIIKVGVLVDRDGPSVYNEFIWRVTFLDESPPGSGDFKLIPFENNLTTVNGSGSATISTTLLVDGETYSSCSGTMHVPSYGGLVKGLQYYGRVTAVNNLGYSLSSKALTPLAPVVVPGAPTCVSLSVVSSNELRVIFGPPTDNGGAAIIQYKIEWSDSITFDNAWSEKLDFLGGGAPFFKTIHSLNMGKFYFVRVNARNTEGYGIAQISTPPSLNPHQPPGAPSSVYLVITSDTTLTVSWDIPLSNGGDLITSFRIEWDTNSNFDSTSIPPNKGYIDLDASTHSSYTIELLSSKKVYFTRVFAINSAGSGTGKVSSPLYAIPSKQVPGIPESLVVSKGNVFGSIDVIWQYPQIPFHKIPCAGKISSPLDCPMAFGHNIFPISDGGDQISEYEVEFNEREDFSGADGGRKIVTGGKLYFVKFDK
eukprot:CAMPEP_0184869082 /NCGR_PEP_ID=MMETSP0580-20130426/32783_1 /TAXON_ID=1118495 /ORGANISM="Dactyliosolen fragilissimus" /LENGTH=1039 /DNA_ID=CAMNT_0027370337 /DNA_START=554 /DNA_END=3672 /DNA_ORIENTATION=-